MVRGQFMSEFLGPVQIPPARGENAGPAWAAAKGRFAVVFEQCARQAVPWLAWVRL